MRRLIIATLLVLAACGRAPSTPSTAPSGGPAAPAPAIADYSGFWNGSFRLTSCTGDRHCVILIGTNRTFALRIRQSGSQVRGLFTSVGYTADVAGEILKDGSVALTGFTPAATVKDGSMRVTGLELRVSSAQSLEGRVAYETTPSLPQSALELPTSAAGDIVSVTRTDLQTFAATIDGTWSGRFAIRSCAPAVGGQYCYPNQDQEVVNFQLSLTRSGDAVTGTFTSGSQSVPVSGRVSGATVTLSGEVLSPSSGGSSLILLTSWTGQVDEFGRMLGAFQYEFRYPSAAPTLGESAVAELWQVLKVS
jgi:hypothetical protein